MFKNIIVLLIALFFIGCAHHNHNTVGGMHSNLETGLTVYHQYNITTAHFTGGKTKTLIHKTDVFKADLDADLPSNIESLDLSMAIVNPHNLQFEIWERVNYIDLKSNKVFYRAEKMRYESPGRNKELVSIDLPVISDEECKVVFRVHIKDPSGETVYHTYTSLYRIKHRTNN